jgi:hypothetical protein
MDIENEILQPEIEIVAPSERKRGRGRPPSEPKLDTVGVDGEAIPKARKKSKPADEKKLAKQLQGIHMIFSAMSGFSELQISDAEADALAIAIQNTADEYDLSLSGKTGALIQLLGAAAMIYIPRAVVINAKIKAARAVDVQHEPTNN